MRNKTVISNQLSVISYLLTAHRLPAGKASPLFTTFCLLFTVYCLLFLMGCPKKYVKPPEEPPKVEEVKPVEVKKEVVEEKALPKPEEITEKALPPEKEAPLAVVEVKKESVFKDVHFDFDKYDIREDLRATLDSIAVWLKKNRDANILIEGHCDERGTNEYNLALGDKRAKATKDYLFSLGVASNRINTISYGEEKPLCTEQNEDCWQRNRRAHFVVTK